METKLLWAKLSEDCNKSYYQGKSASETLVPPALRAAGTAGMRFAPSVVSLGAERLANHGMELCTPLITGPAARYQGAPHSSRPFGGRRAR